MLVDGDVIDPLVVKGIADRGSAGVPQRLPGGYRPETLGDYAGLAESFLFAGASAVVASLWSIDDGVASALAERFYTRAFAGERWPRSSARTRARHGHRPQLVDPSPTSSSATLRCTSRNRRRHRWVSDRWSP
jgi:hypothetical protein